MRLRTIRDAARRHSCECRNPAPSEYLEPEALDPGFRRDDGQGGWSAWWMSKPSGRYSENAPSFLRKQGSSAFGRPEPRALDPGYRRDDGQGGRSAWWMSKPSGRYSENAPSFLRKQESSVFGRPEPKALDPGFRRDDGQIGQPLRHEY